MKGLSACCLLLVASAFAENDRPVATDHVPPSTDVCTDLEGHTEACPEKAQKSEPGGQKPKLKNSTRPIAKSTAATENQELRTAGSNFVRDQKWFWTSPFRIRENDLQWLLPLTLGTTALVASDTAIEPHLPQSKSTIDRSRTFSDYGVAAFAAGSAGAYFLGRVRSDDHLCQTGLLSAEAAADSFLATEVIKPIAGRDRPLEGNGRGGWFQGGSSFPSEHAAAAWSMATVIAGQYPSWRTKFLAYGGAAAVSAARVIAHEHFTSDAVIGSALGWYIGQHVLSHATDSGERQREIARMGVFQRTSDAGGVSGGDVCADLDGHPEACPDRNQDPELRGQKAEARSRNYGTENQKLRTSKNMGSPYVPLDSWIYSAFDRLIALGYVKPAFAGLRPWTRMECARMLVEAKDEVPLASAPTIGAAAAPARLSRNGKREAEVRSIYDALNREFAYERTLREAGGRNLQARVESVYTRFTGISGQPLTDGYDFGQTISNDYGRPYQQGFNNVTGTSSYATAGPLALYMRGEYQYAPSGSALPASTRAAVAVADGLPVNDIPGGPFPATNRFRLLDSYIALNVSDWQLSFGKQSLWWGPNNSSSLQLSNNAEPVWMLRASRVTPFKLPSILGLLGPVRGEGFLGQLQGHDFLCLGEPTPNCAQLVGSPGVPVDPQPYMWGGKINFHPTPNLEFGVSVTAIFAGYGRPLTLATFLHTFTPRGNNQLLDPGKRTGGFDFRYRVPGLRNWLTLYASSMTWDEINPIAYPRRAAMNTGIYMPKLPGIPKLDLHVEGVYTDLPNLQAVGMFYYNLHYINGYTNYGQVMGSWIGRQGSGLQAWSRYWLSPRNTVEVGFRGEDVNRDFLQGGRLRDVYADVSMMVKRDVQVSFKLQHELWKFPVLAPTEKDNTVFSMQLNYVLPR
jgi:hypothetical protein